MKDNEIIKALECCMKEDGCEHCPYYTNERYTCGEHFNKDMFDLINRQKKEVERLEADKKTFENVIKNSFLEKAGIDIDPLAEIKAEGIKEFWNELKSRNTMDERIVSVASGDNLVKEMVGAESGN